MLSKKDFVDFVINTINTETPGLVFRKKEGDFEYEITYVKNEEIKAIMNFENTFNAYTRTKSEKMLEQEIKKQAKLIRDAFNNSTDDRTKNLIQNITPIVRNSNFTTIGSMDNHNYTLPFEALSKELIILFGYDDGENIQYIDNGIIEKSNLTFNRLKEIAIKNIYKQGWVKYKEKEKLNNGYIYIFHDSKPYQYQFFLKEMVEKRISRNFYITFPDKFHVAVYSPSQGIGDTLDIRYLDLITNNIIENSPQPLSDTIHRVFNGKVSIIK